jgi:hypothetical protein
VGRFIHVHPVFAGCLGCPVRVSEVIRTGKLLKLNEFAGHKKKIKKLLDRKRELLFTGCS